MNGYIDSNAYYVKSLSNALLFINISIFIRIDTNFIIIKINSKANDERFDGICDHFQHFCQYF